MCTFCDAPWIKSASDSFTINLYHSIASYNCKWYTILKIGKKININYRLISPKNTTETDAYAGGARGCIAPPKKTANLAKIKKKRRKKSQNQENLQNFYHKVVYKWVKSEEFSRG